MNDKTYDFTESLQDMDGGVFLQRISQSVAQTALATANQEGGNPRKGKVTITLDMEKIADSRQLKVSHKVSYDKPTKRGKLTEDNTTSTPMYVGPRGALTLFPDNQVELFNHGGSEDA